MVRRFAAFTVLTLVLATIGTAVVTASADPGNAAPAKTTAPPPPGSPTTGPGDSGTPTSSLWPTTTPPTATTFPDVTRTPPPPSPTTTPGAHPATVPPPPTETVTTIGGVPGAFDAPTFFGEFYGALSLDPVDALGMVEVAAIRSPADGFLFHEIGATIAIFAHTSQPLPAYTVTPSGPAVQICRDDGVCETYSDFVMDGPLLDSFSIDGQPLADRASTYLRDTTIESLTISELAAVRRPRDELLSIVVVMETSIQGGVTVSWDQATYVDASGRGIPVDLAASNYPARLEADGFDVAHVSFPGGVHGGQLVLPFTSDTTGVATTIRVPVVLGS